MVALLDFLWWLSSGHFGGASGQVVGWVVPSQKRNFEDVAAVAVAVALQRLLPPVQFCCI